MNSMQYEELCRFFIAEKLGLKVEDVAWRRVKALTRPGEPPDAYQIDLCWEHETPLGRCLFIADAKWRTSQKIDRENVLVLEQSRLAIGAHKAMLITNAEVTKGVRLTALRLGIAVHRLIPQPLPAHVSTHDRGAIQTHLRACAEAAARARRGRAPPPPLYHHLVICKGAGVGRAPFPVGPSMGTRILGGPAAISPPSPAAPPALSAPPSSSPAASPVFSPSRGAGFTPAPRTPFPAPVRGPAGPMGWGGRSFGINK